MLARTLRVAFFFACLVALPSLAHAVAMDLGEPPAGFDGTNNGIPHGMVRRTQMYPTRNHGMQKVSVYTPPDYSMNQKYPVLYLLHGIGGNETAWLASEGNANNVLDFLISKNLAKPMIVVLPDGNVDGASDGFGAFGDVLLNDLIPWVQSNFSTLTDADNRALSGLSMGGGQTFNFGFPNIDTFHYIGPYSPAPNTMQPTALVKDLAALKAKVKVIFISCGSNDGICYSANGNGNSQTWDKYLDTNMVSHLYYVKQGAVHDKNFWNRSLFHFAQRIFGGPNGGTGAGGTSGSGGATATGGAGGGNTGMAGNSGGGGMNTGGVGSGGQATGGRSGSGGASASGGAAATGGAPGTGGAVIGSGGSAPPASGGAPASGGQAASGGRPGTGGSGAPGAGGGDDAAGCSCSIDRGAPRASALAIAALGIIGLVRRRRRLPRTRN